MSETNESSLGPGKAFRKGMSLMELMDLFPDDDAAERWFTEARWPGGKVRCPRCNGPDVHRGTHREMPYRCRKCRRHFSVRTGTLMQSSNLGFQKWAFGIYLFATNLKGTSSMHLHRDLGISQKAAWHMGHRIRALWKQNEAEWFDGPVEVDEAYVGGKERWKHADKRLRSDWKEGKDIVAAARDHASGQINAFVVPDTIAEIMVDWVYDRIDIGTEVFTDDNPAYRELPYHRIVRHSVGQYVNEQATTNGVESFWAMLKRGYVGTYHRMSPVHLQRYVDEFAGRHNQRKLDTELTMIIMYQRMVGKRLTYRELAYGLLAGRMRVAE